MGIVLVILQKMLLVVLFVVVQMVMIAQMAGIVGAGVVIASSVKPGNGEPMVPTIVV